jgi:hypothetical protein
MEQYFQNACDIFMNEVIMEDEPLHFSKERMKKLHMHKDYSRNHT